MNKIQEILRQYPYIADDAAEIQKEMYKYLEMQEELRQTVLKAQVITDEPRTGGNNDSTYNAIVQIIDKYQANINRCITQLNELDKRKKWLDKAYLELTEEERRIVLMRYNKNMSLRRIGNVVHRSKDNVLKIIIETERKISRIIS